MNDKRIMITGFIGAAIAALCCFTPILVILLGAVGFSSFTSYLDFVLLPALCIMIALSVVSFLQWHKSVANNSSYKA